MHHIIHSNPMYVSATRGSRRGWHGKGLQGAVSVSLIRGRRRNASCERSLESDSPSTVDVASHTAPASAPLQGHSLKIDCNLDPCAETPAALSVALPDDCGARVDEESSPRVHSRPRQHPVITGDDRYR